MRKALVRAVLPAVLVVGLSAAPAEADSVTSATFTGVVTTALPLTLTTVNTAVTFNTTLCVEAAAHVAKQTKPPATAGMCKITTEGTFIGNCAFGLGSTQGTYTDSVGQTFQIFLGFVAVTPTWTTTANFLKPQTNQSGTGAGEGTWAPDLIQCAAGGTTTVMVTAEFSFTLI